MSDSKDVITEPRLEKRTRRRFSVAEKKRLLAEADALPHGEKGAWLRRKGLYAGQLSTWRKYLAEHGEAGVAAREPGRKPADPRDKELERNVLERFLMQSAVGSWQDHDQRSAAGEAFPPGGRD